MRVVCVVHGSCVEGMCSVWGVLRWGRSVWDGVGWDDNAPAPPTGGGGGGVGGIGWAATFVWEIRRFHLAAKPRGFLLCPPICLCFACSMSHSLFLASVKFPTANCTTAKWTRHQVPPPPPARLHVQEQREGDCWITDTCKLPSSVMSPIFAPAGPMPPIAPAVRDLLHCTAVRTPDLHGVLLVRLAACGFQSSASLANKIVALFTLCRKQLACGQQLPWGAAFATTIINKAGVLLRSSKTKHEDLILKKAIRDTVHPRLSPEDGALFLTLLNDVYPGYFLDSVLYLQVVVPAVLRWGGECVDGVKQGFA